MSMPLHQTIDVYHPAGILAKMPISIDNVQRSPQREDIVSGHI